MISYNWNNLSKAAWTVRDNAFIFGDTKVGCAIMSEKGAIYSGCNIEHIFRISIHAEVNAISNMISSGEIKFSHILVVAEREYFTPCGACMDWIIQHGGNNCIVGFQNSRSGNVQSFFASELMPHYPR